MEIVSLVDRCRRGDALAWEALVRRFQGRVHAIAYHYLGNPEEARDLAQEVFVRIYDRLDTCTNAETFVPWMFRIARNAALDRLRRIKARPSVVSAPIEDLPHLVSGDPGPAELAERSARVDLVHRAMEKLSRINREMILLKEIQGMTFEEIALLLDLPVGTVKSRSSRARIELAREVVALRGEADLDTIGNAP